MLSYHIFVTLYFLVTYRKEKGLAGYEHEKVIHSRGEYVRGDAWTNGIESFWSGIKRGIMGVYHKMGKKHLWRYVTEFVARQNMRVKDTIDQMKLYVLGD